MKKTLLTIATLATTICAVAQHSTKPVITENQTNFSLANADQLKTAVASTLMPTSMMSGGCATSTTSTGGVVYYSISQATATPQYTIDTRGYMFGTNTSAASQVSGTTTISYTTTTLKSAQKYTVTGSGNTVTNLIVLVGKAKSDMAMTMVNAMILSENATTKAPGTQIGTSASKALNSFSTSAPNVINFTTPVAIPAGKFFAAIEAPALGGSMHDSLAIISTKAGCSSTDSLSWVYENIIPFTAGSSWYSVKSFYGSNNNLDIAIWPVIDITAGLGSVSKNGLTLLASYPNPTANEVSINFGLATGSKVTIDVCDLTGKVISTNELGTLTQGNHTSKLNVADLASGVYMYSIKSDDAKMYSKFTVAK